MSLDQALAFAKNNHERFLDELIQLVSIPSISTDADKKESMHQAADFVAHQLQQLGFQKVKAFPTALHPIVYGERFMDITMYSRPTRKNFGYLNRSSQKFGTVIYTGAVLRI
jgi:acetylornithine deacetylase/succinyl-diaminopimelate desuccinylase-like protein